MCSVCLHGEGDYALPCGHRFHARCVELWLKRSRTCPCCRASVARPVAPVLLCLALFWVLHALMGSAFVGADVALFVATASLGRALYFTPGCGRSAA